MKPLLTLLFLLISMTSAFSQTAIDLKTGKVHASKLDVSPLHKTRIQARDRALALRDSLEYGECIGRAFDLLLLDSLSVAQQHVERALKLRPDAPGNHILHHILGKIFWARRQHKDAIRCFSEILDEHPEDIALRFDRATVYYESRQFSALLDDCTALLSQITPADTAHRKRALYLKSAAHSHLSQHTQELQALSEILDMSPFEESAEVLSALALRKLERQEEAVARLNLLLQRCPRSVEALMARASCEKDAERWDAARDDYDQVIEIAPQHSEAYVERAAVLLRLGLKHAARKDLEKAQQLGTPYAELKSLFEKL